MNDARAYMVAKLLIDADRSPPSEAIKDPGVDLKSML